MPGRIGEALDEAGVLARVLLEKDMLHRLHPRALPVLVRQRIAGTSGPSTMYRLNAATQPDEEALIWGDRRLTWGELDARIDQLTAGLRSRHGLREGDSAVLMLHNRGELLEAMAAMSRLGGGAVPISWRSTPEELDYLVNHCGARAIFVESSLSDVVRRTRDTLTNVPDENLVSVGGAAEGFTRYEDVLAATGGRVRESLAGGSVVIYTSGTTGKPKGAVRSFPREAQNAVLRFLLETPMRHGDRHLVTCPMYHSTAFGFIAFTMIVGGSLVIMERFDPEAFLAAVERERITTTAMVPTLLHRLLDLPESVTARYDTRSLRAVFSGGSALSGALARRFMERFGHVLYNFYGATETGINTLASPEELLRAPGTIGHVVPGNEIRLLDEDGAEVAAGETGELWVRNSMLVSGYHKDDEATRRSMRDGFFSVGDLAHFDTDGLLHIDGRKRDMIISGGVNVYPAEVEEVLSRHPGIAEAAVIGIPDDEWGERVRAFVRLHAGAELSIPDLTGWAREKLAGPKLPRDVVFVDELPKNPTGKVLKRELRKL